MKIDIVIPAYNEELIIRESIEEIQRALKSLPHDVHIVVADNGSTDNTALHAEGAGATVLDVPARGKGAALIHAATHSEAPLFVFIDADLSASPTEIHALLAALEREQADIVIGSRLLDQSAVNRSFLRTLTSQLFNLARRIILGVSVSDTQCGLKLMNEKGRRLLAACEETGWFLDIELLARAEKEGLRIHEIPVAWEEFRYSNRTSKLNLMKDSVAALMAMLRIRSRLS